MTRQEFALDDRQIRVMLETGVILREAARFREAERIFLGAAEFLPDSEIPLVGLGTVNLQRGDFAAAREMCRKGLEINPSSLYARVHHAEALLFGGERERAEEELLAIADEARGTPAAETARALLEAADLISPK